MSLFNGLKIHTEMTILACIALVRAFPRDVLPEERLDVLTESLSKYDAQGSSILTDAPREFPSG